MPRIGLVCSLVIVFASGALFAQNRAVGQPSTVVNLKDSALLRAEGKSIKVNGVAVHDSIAIFPEDRIETGADTTAYVILAGRILTLDRNSVAVFEDGYLVPFLGRAWASDGVGDSSVKSLKLADSQLGSVGLFPTDNDEHFKGICKKYAKACDQAEDACERKYHKDCVCHYHNNHDKDDISPIHPDADDFVCHPIK